MRRRKKVREYAFEIQGPLRGFLATYKAPWTKEAKSYVSFKEKVRLMANCAGIPDELLPLQCAEINLSVHWNKKARIDCVNVYKAAEDGLFRKDRRVLKGSFIALENTGEEKAFVRLTIG